MLKFDASFLDECAASLFRIERIGSQVMWSDEDGTADDLESRVIISIKV